jgi:hypothetical protein
MILCSYERRLEYLQACINTGEGNKPMSCAWLSKYAERKEGVPEKQIASGFVRIPLPDALWDRLKHLGRYYGTAVSDLVAAQCVETVQRYIVDKLCHPLCE